MMKGHQNKMSRFNIYAQDYGTLKDLLRINLEIIMLGCQIFNLDTQTILSLINHTPVAVVFLHLFQQHVEAASPDYQSFSVLVNTIN